VLEDDVVRFVGHRTTIEAIAAAGKPGISVVV
jgi:hypothetical protein